MVAYDGRYGPQSCYDCGAQATQDLGRRIKRQSGRAVYFGCDDCASARLGRGLKPKEVESPPTPTRNDRFMQGHDEPKYTQGSLFDE